MELFKYYNFNWLNTSMYQFMTKTIVEKMLAGKITNNLDVIKEYVKVMRLKCSPALLLKLFITDDNRLSKTDFLREASVAKDINHLIEHLLNPNDQRGRIIFQDMVKEAQILEKKIDYKWSHSRLVEEHKAWTEQIMQIEIDTLDNTTIPDIERFDRYTPDNFKLLKTQKEVFYEGKTMKHCVYTAYWPSIKNGSYLAYHIEQNGEEATLGVNVYEDKIVYNQCYSRYNGNISSALKLTVMQFVENLNEQVRRDGVSFYSVQNYTLKDDNIINELPF